MKIRVYYLFREIRNENKKIAEWINGFKAKDELEVDEQYNSEEQAPFCGYPFLVVGTQSQINSYFKSLSDSAKSIIKDCSYYWILSDTDNTSNEFMDIQDDRDIVLNWKYKNYDLIWDQLRRLQECPDLIGLSKELHRIRMAIKRISHGQTGPGKPVLILGETGSGKEVVAKSLYKASAKSENVPFGEVACGWLSETLLQSDLFGHKKGSFTGAISDKKGLLETHTNGVIFFDDFDAAPMNIQAALLRMLDTPVEGFFRFSRLGESDVNAQAKTKTWPFFSLNKDIVSLIKDGKLREDFIFRFEERVIHIPPLRRRLADVPALIHHIWEKVTEKSEGPFYPKAVEWLMNREIKWEGNVRALRALLSLCASMCKLPEYKAYALSTILDKIISRGSDYYSWMGIIETFTDDPNESPPLNEKELIEKARDLINVKKFDAVLGYFKGKKARIMPYDSRIARIICHVADKNEIDIETAQTITDIKSRVSIEKIIKPLVEENLLKEEPSGGKNRKKYLKNF